MPKVAQKFGEEAVECLIEAVAGNREALIGESADVLYHLHGACGSPPGCEPAEVWAELDRREGVSGLAEKAARAQKRGVGYRVGTTRKFPDGRRRAAMPVSGSATTTTPTSSPASCAAKSRAGGSTRTSSPSPSTTSRRRRRCMCW